MNEPALSEAAPCSPNDVHGSREQLVRSLHEAMRATRVVAAASDIRVRAKIGHMMPVVSIE